MQNNNYEFILNIYEEEERLLLIDSIIKTCLIFSPSPLLQGFLMKTNMFIWQEIENICYINWVMSCYERIIEGLVSLIFYIINFFGTSISVSMLLRVKRVNKKHCLSNSNHLQNDSPHPPPPNPHPTYIIFNKAAQEVDLQWINNGWKQCSRYLNKFVWLPISFFLDDTKLTLIRFQKASPFPCWKWSP